MNKIFFTIVALIILLTGCTQMSILENDSLSVSESQLSSQPVLEQSSSSEVSLEAPADPGVEDSKAVESFEQETKEQEEEDKLLEAMCQYLMENLSQNEYMAIRIKMHDENNQHYVEVLTTDSTLAEELVKTYDGEPVKVEYVMVPFSLAELEQAKVDLQSFLEINPHIEFWSWDWTYYDGITVELKETSLELSEFVKDYPIKNIYNIQVFLDHPPMHPD